LQPIDVRHALARLAQFLLGAEIGPNRIVELQIAAAGPVKCLDRLLIRGGEIVEELIGIAIDVLVDAVLGKAEMQYRRGGGGAFFPKPWGGPLEILVWPHPVGRESELSPRAQPPRPPFFPPGLHGPLPLPDL